MSRKNDSSVKAFVRLRPSDTMNLVFPISESKSKSQPDLVPKHLQLCVTPKGAQTASTFDFTFDGVFRPPISQANVFDAVGRNLCNQFLSGKSGTIFIYGSVSSGKSYSLFGGSNEARGLLPRAVEYIYDSFRRMSLKDNIILNARFLDFHLDDIRNLVVEKEIGETKAETVRVVEQVDGVVDFEGAPPVRLRSIEEVLRILKDGMGLRTKEQVEGNRSHIVFSLILQRNGLESVLNFVELASTDLAQSPNADLEGFMDQTYSSSSASASSQSHKEQTHVNRTLSTLCSCLMSLDRGEGYIPHSDSVLTLALKPQLQNDCSTVVLGTVLPTSASSNIALSTLQFLARARRLQNVTNSDSSDGAIQSQDRKIKALISEVAFLKAELERTHVHYKTRLQQLSSPAGSSAAIISKNPVEIVRMLEGSQGEKTKLQEKLTQLKHQLTDEGERHKLRESQLQAQLADQRDLINALKKTVESLKTEAELERMDLERKNLKERSKIKDKTQVALQQQYESIMGDSVENADLPDLQNSIRPATAGTVGHGVGGGGGGSRKVGRSAGKTGAPQTANSEALRVVVERVEEEKMAEIKWLTAKYEGLLAARDKEMDQLISDYQSYRVRKSEETKAMQRLLNVCVEHSILYSRIAAALNTASDMAPPPEYTHLQSEIPKQTLLAQLQRVTPALKDYIDARHFPPLHHLAQLSGSAPGSPLKRGSLPSLGSSQPLPPTVTMAVPLAEPDLNRPTVGMATRDLRVYAEALKRRLKVAGSSPTTTAQPNHATMDVVELQSELESALKEKEKYQELYRQAARQVLEVRQAKDVLETKLEALTLASSSPPRTHARSHSPLSHSRPHTVAEYRSDHIQHTSTAGGRRLEPIRPFSRLHTLTPDDLPHT